METRMKKESAALIKLSALAAGVNNTPPADLDGLDWRALYRLAKFHDLSNVVCYAAEKCGAGVPEEVMSKLSSDKEKALFRTASQMTASELVKDALSSAKVRFMLLKGSVIRSLYPSEDMRTSGDVDILYDENDIGTDELEELMKQLGFSKTKGSKTVDCFTDGLFVVFEMHRSLCYDKDKRFLPKSFESILKDSKAVGCGGFEKAMSNEDYYVFHISHMAKHFCSHGCGIRPLIDMHLYLGKYGGVLDFDYIAKKLSEVGLLKFEEQARLLSETIFTAEVTDSLSEHMLNVMMFSGVYGNSLRTAANDRVSASGKSSVFIKNLKTAFLPMENMRVRYPVLKKAPILLPAMWCVRIADVLTHKQGKVKNSFESFSSVDDETVEENKRLMNELGL